MLVTRDPSRVSEDDVERLRAHGWSDAAIHDAIQVISFFNYINRVADAVGIEAEPEWQGHRQSARLVPGPPEAADKPRRSDTAAS